VEDQVRLLNTKVNEIDFQIKTTLPPLEGIFYDEQIFDALGCVILESLYSVSLKHRLSN
jgi:hypothetical protein